MACFASNVARMDTAIRAAEACGRRVCLVGRSMHRMAAAAKSVGLFQDIKAFISDGEANHLPDHGGALSLHRQPRRAERAALSRIAEGDAPACAN